MGVKIVLYDEAEVKYMENIKGWVSSEGYYHGNNKDSEEHARYASCTHKKCSCGNLMRKYYRACSECREKKKIERYKKMPYKEYDYKSPVYSEYLDKFFQDHGELCDYCYDNELNPVEMGFIICEYEYCSEIDPYDYYQDIIPEETEYLPDYVIEAFDELNAKLSERKVCASYVPGKYRTDIEC